MYDSLHHRAMTRHASGALVALLFTAAAARADVWGLEDIHYFDPPIAGPREATIKVLFPAWSQAFPFAQKAGSRWVWDISLGKEIPIVGYQTTDQRDGEFAVGDWGLGLWIPIGFHMVEDLSGDPSSPILDTDYKFGGSIKFRLGVARETWLKARLTIGHESTHIGDEFALAAQRNSPTEFLRINVSHEDWDFATGLDTIIAELHQLRGSIGLLGLLNPSKGYYSTDVLETNGRVVPASHNNLEPYGDVEYFHGTPVLGTWGPWVSTDLRYRSIYDYTRSSAAVAERRQLSLNVLVGLRDVEQKPTQKGKVDVYFRYYYGVNPAGQFRSQGNYTLVGLGLHVPI
jgi:hypothetical protein